MGNKLCAPLLKKNYRGHESHPWNIRKDSHLLRLWADVFRVHGSGDYSRWERVSEDVVPVNISCIEDTPHTVFQITAYNRQVEKIFDVKITQPGTIICPATECFVHWRDPVTNREWGLNFSTPTDARRFRDCCSYPTQRFARKASSASSLHVSPPKGVKGKAVPSSSPSSPVLTRHHLVENHHLDPSQRRHPAPTPTPTTTSHALKAASLPRASSAAASCRDGSQHYFTVTKRKSESNVLENCQGTVLRRASSEQSPSGGGGTTANTYNTYNATSSSSASSYYYTMGTGSATCQRKSMPSMSSSSAISAAASSSACRESPSKRQLQDMVRPASAISDITAQKIESPKRVVIGDVITASRTSSPVPGMAAHHEKPNGILKKESSGDRGGGLLPPGEKHLLQPHPHHHPHPTLSRCVSMDAERSQQVVDLPPPPPPPPAAAPEDSLHPHHHHHLSPSPSPTQKKSHHLSVDTFPSGNNNSNNSNNSRHTSSSESPEWPSPPEPLTPQTPTTPLGHMEFDSDTIKRLLRSLPSSPIDKEDLDLGFHDDPSLAGGKGQGRRASQLSRTKSLNTHDRVPAKGSNSVRSRQSHVVVGPVVCKAGEVQRSKMFNKVALEEELRKRNRCAKAAAASQHNYPDSGIGIAAETAPSIPSESSGKSSRRDRFRGQEGLSTESSHDSEDPNSDLIIQKLGDGPELRQYLAPELTDEDDEGSTGSLDTMMETDSQISFTRQAGAIRKAGWLVVKNWLAHKKKKLELAPRRTWKRYWVCLKGTTLLFFDSGEESAASQGTVPRHILVIEGGIAQAVPEHPKRENIFSLSTACGDGYLFQASSQIDLENWIRAVHSACASSFARQHGKDNTLKLLSSELEKLETNIDTDVKMRKMAELQMTVVTDPRSRLAIVKQIAQWEENLEKLYIDQYRFRCYIASLQGTELPNPKVLLASACKATKTTLGRLGIFTVTSFHALVSARKPLVLPPNLMGRGATSHKGGMLSPRADHAHQHAHGHAHTSKPRSRTPTGTLNNSVSSEGLYRTNVLRAHESVENLLERSTTEHTLAQESLSRVTLPNNQCYNFQTMLIGVDKGTSVRDLLESTCTKRQLNPRDHYVRIKPMGSTDDKFVIPDRHDIVKKLRYDAIEVCQKCMFQLELTKPTKDGMFGFAVEAELADDYDRDDELQVYVCEITPGGVAESRGLIVGDEVLVINGKVVAELDMVYIETLLHESRTLFLTVRSMRTQPPRSEFITQHTDTYIKRFVCPPPSAASASAASSSNVCGGGGGGAGGGSGGIGGGVSSHQSRLAERSLGDFISSSASSSSGRDGERRLPMSDHALANPGHPDHLYKNADQMLTLGRSKPEGGATEDGAPGTRSLSDAQRMRKVIMELVETERAYVKDLLCLLTRYLEPLKEETFLTSDKVSELFGNITEIVQFQQQFLHSLEQAIELEPDFFTTDDTKLFKRVLFSIGGSFLYYANHFKVYSSFCASHSRTQKILNPDANEALREFLLARNPKQQHSATLESYMIKPIQRILKYPLLLQQLCAHTLPATDERHHLTEALKGMEAVAEHINEMQKIYEEYGSVFNELTRTFRDVHPSKPPIELSVGDLQMYGTVEWCNMTDYLGKVKKTTDFENIVFVFKMGVVFLCCERQKRRKSKSLSTKGSGSDNLDLQEKFRTLVPTREVAVRVGKVADIDRHFWWDLIHTRSDPDGRPERVYQFCNSTSEAKSDFMKVIRQTIRESTQ
ncbi:protein still life, isoform SIF type 1-like isoform X2 [Babylonia areolata]|uniref:protein still life, isoform SIF type 1-like isoform X2 n=1 Tax=Babylonia areolata TaxID=304850 RepID=UPI003FD41716